MVLILVTATTYATPDSFSHTSADPIPDSIPHTCADKGADTGPNKGAYTVTHSNQPFLLIQ